ncbi:MAG: response regulator [Elusimicrobia bacterium]|nr:response regulator [Elusimicrobiota bacterium]
MLEKTILLIEDNPDDAHLTLEAFKAAGVRARFAVATNGSEALNYLRDAEEPPAFILLDLNLPKLSGHEILERIRAGHGTKSVPVIILTSSIETADLVRCYALGANSFVRKPVDFGQFLDIARLLGRYWLEINVALPAGRA